MNLHLVMMIFFPTRSCRRRLVLVICFAVTIGLYWKLKPLIRSRDHPKYFRQVESVLDVKKEEGTWLSSDEGTACVQPQLQLWHPQLKNYFRDPKPLECNKVEPNWVDVKNGTFLISQLAVEKHGPIKCRYIPLLRGNSNDDTVLEGTAIDPMVHGTPITSDFSSVQCTANDGTKYNNVLSGIAYSNDPHSRPTKLPDNSLGLNIIMFGLDSTSHMTWMRNLPRTHDYVVNQLGGIVMEGYNIVGDGTPQALLPILTGMTEIELPEARKNFQDAKPVDNHPWIWKDLKQHGYVTQWGEDGAGYGTFNYRMLGFTEQPVDHYLRPFYLTIEKLYHLSKPFCLGSVPRHLNMLNWIRQFVNMYPQQPKFSFLFHSEYSHGGYSESRVADQDVKDLIWELNERGILDNTLLIMMADHGARFQKVRQTEQGKYEERLPYMVIRVPPSFRVKHPEIVKNLEINAKRLTTPFDIHATFHDVLSYSGPGVANVSDRSISLFKEIPKERTCAHAAIEPHWCTCLNWVKVALDDSIVHEAGRHLVNAINGFMTKQKDQCEELSLHNVTSAVTYTANDNMLRFKNSKDFHGRVPNLSDTMKPLEVLYQIAITTTPGQGQFEATLRYIVKDLRFVLNEKEISRLNIYGSQPACIMKELPHLRPYCYCKKEIAS